MPVVMRVQSAQKIGATKAMIHTCDDVFRAIEALVLMGNPLFHGASSTLLGILLLGFSESFVFTVFFRMMVMVSQS